MMTAKQKEYLTALIEQHPNFRAEVRYDGVHLKDEGYNYYRNTGNDWPNDKMFIGERWSTIAKWINSKYSQFIQNPVNSLEDLSIEEASALITHLRLRKK